jgi:hypothetical protein
LPTTCHAGNRSGPTRQPKAISIEAAAEKEAIARVDGVVPVGGGGLEGVVVAVLAVLEKGIVHIACEQGGSVAERD